MQNNSKWCKFYFFSDCLQCLGNLASRGCGSCQTRPQPSIGSGSKCAKNASSPKETKNRTPPSPPFGFPSSWSSPLNMAVVVKNGLTPKWLALVNGTKNYNLWSPGGLILTHTHIVPQRKLTCDCPNGDVQNRQAWTPAQVPALFFLSSLPVPCNLSFPSIASLAQESEFQTFCQHLHYFLTALWVYLGKKQLGVGGAGDITGSNVHQF